MNKVLVVVESPAKAKTIGKFLGKKYSVKASMGHVRDLPKSQFGVDVTNDFQVKYITIRGKGQLLKELKSEAKKCDKILLATDPDREGEAIAWHLRDFFKIPEGENCRVEFNEITKNTIKDAVKTPRQIDSNRVEAQQVRRVLDRIVGYNLSPLLWRKIRKGLSAGRVQSVVVRLICDREKEITDFEPEEYWTLTANLKKKRVNFDAKLAKIDKVKAELKNEKEVSEIIASISDELFKVEKIKKRQQKRNPPPPFTTSSLQQDAFRKLNFTAKKTMMIAQQLYEGLDLSKKEGTVGLITYIRTDSTRVSNEAQSDVRELIKENYGEEYVSPNPNIYKGKGKIQNAHECIRPTLVTRTPDSIKEYLSRDQYRLYKLVFERFIASQMSPAIVAISTADISVKNYMFRASGSEVTFLGFTCIYEEGKDNSDKEQNKRLPELIENEELTLNKLDPKQHFTQPPPRYSEATLIKTLEEKGIGRPSTYAPILDTITKRGYVSRQQKQYYATELGELVVDLLKKYFPEIIDVEFTANMEDELDAVEEGEMYWKKVLAKFYEPFSKELEIADKEIEQIEISDEETDEVCELCGRNMVIKSGRFGKFLACPGFPECRNTKPLLQDIGVVCPKCHEGNIVVRTSKKGRKFYGCSNYPKCDFISWDEPVQGECPVCGSHLVMKNTKKNGQEIKCANKECSYSKKMEEN